MGCQKRKLVYFLSFIPKVQGSLNITLMFLRDQPVARHDFSAEQEQEGQ
jgi:hypothetical protein